jgi:hypothetical protein
MATHDTTDALKYLHPDVPFATFRYDTTTDLATLSDIFKNKFQKPLAPQFSQQSPSKAAKNKRPAANIQLVLRSPVKYAYQKRLRTQLNTT